MPVRRGEEVVGPTAIIRRRGQKIYGPLAAIMLLMALGGLEVPGSQPGPQTPVQRQPAPSEPLVIQGRITGIQGALVRVKTPDGYPGGPGVHAQFVVAGPTFTVDVSSARVLLPGGKQADRRPLAVGDRVLMVLSRPDSDSSAPANPGSVNQTYFASVIERIVASDTIVTH